MAVSEGTFNTSAFAPGRFFDPREVLGIVQTQDSVKLIARFIERYFFGDGVYLKLEAGEAPNTKYLVDVLTFKKKLASMEYENRLHAFGAWLILTMGDKLASETPLGSLDAASRMWPLSNMLPAEAFALLLAGDPAKVPFDTSYIPSGNCGRPICPDLILALATIASGVLYPDAQSLQPQSQFGLALTTRWVGTDRVSNVLLDLDRMILVPNFTSSIGLYFGGVVTLPAIPLPSIPNSYLFTGNTGTGTDTGTGTGEGGGTSSGAAAQTAEKPNILPWIIGGAALLWFLSRPRK